MLLARAGVFGLRQAVCCLMPDRSSVSSRGGRTPKLMFGLRVRMSCKTMIFSVRPARPSKVSLSRENIDI